MKKPGRRPRRQEAKQTQPRGRGWPLVSTSWLGSRRECPVAGAGCKARTRPSARVGPDPGGTCAEGPLGTPVLLVGVCSWAEAAAAGQAGCAVGMTVHLSSFLHPPPLTPPPRPHPPSTSLLCAGSCFLSGPLQAWVWWPLQRGGAEVTSPCSSHYAASWLPVPERPSRGTHPMWLFLGREQDLLEVPQVHCCTGLLHPELSQRWEWAGLSAALI